MIAVLVALCASALTALNQVLVKAATRRLSPLLVNYLRLLVASAVMSPVAVLCAPKLARLGPLVALNVLYVAAAGPVLAWYLYTRALKGGEVSVLHPIGNSYPAIAVLLSFLLLGESVRLNYVAALALVTAGAAIVTKQRGERCSSASVAMAAAAALLWGSNVIAFKLLTYSLSSVEIAALRALTAAAMLTPAALPKLRGVRASDAKVALAAGLVGDVLTFTAWVTAIGIGPISLVMPVIATAPVLSALLSRALLAERVGGARMAGVALASLGVGLLFLE